MFAAAIKRRFYFRNSAFCGQQPCVCLAVTTVRLRIQECAYRRIRFASRSDRPANL